MDKIGLARKDGGLSWMEMMSTGGRQAIKCLDLDGGGVPVKILMA